jgi:hypothetical protein
LFGMGESGLNFDLVGGAETYIRAQGLALLSVMRQYPFG